MLQFHLHMAYNELSITKDDCDYRDSIVKTIIAYTSYLLLYSVIEQNNPNYS